MLIKAKDWVTLGNAFGGLMTIFFVIAAATDWNYIYYASWSLIFAYFCDVSDGAVARLTNQHNSFGAELDNVADLVSYSIAPTFLVYGFYAFNPDHWNPPWWFLVPIASLPALIGTIRFARFNTQKISYDGVWLGFPRPAAALMIVGYFNSHLAQGFDFLYWMGLFVVVYTAYAQLKLMPFYNHHKSKHTRPVKITFFFLGTTMLFAIFTDILTGAGVTFDIVTFWLLLYLFAHRRFALPPEELRKIDAFIAEWKRKEAKMLEGGGEGH